MIRELQKPPSDEPAPAFGAPVQEESHDGRGRGALLSSDEWLRYFF